MGRVAGGSWCHNGCNRAGSGWSQEGHYSSKLHWLQRWRCSHIDVFQNGVKLKTLDDYVKVLYSKQWLNASPLKPALGSLTNYTLDSFFGGERLVRPHAHYKAREKDTKLIDISDDDGRKITGNTLAELLESGKLFAVDRKSPSSIFISSTDKGLLQIHTKRTRLSMSHRNSTTSMARPCRHCSTSTTTETCSHWVSRPTSARTLPTHHSTSRMTGYWPKSCSMWPTSSISKSYISQQRTMLERRFTKPPCGQWATTILSWLSLIVWITLGYQAYSARPWVYNPGQFVNALQIDIF